MFRDKSLTLYLTYLGALPFWLAVIAYLADVQVAFSMRAFLAYGSAIAAFLAGTTWTAAHWSETRSVRLLLASNGIALTVFAVLAFPVSPIVALIVQAGCFLALLALDLTIFRNGDQPRWYLSLRVRITAIVLTAYAAMGIASAAG